MSNIVDFAQRIQELLTKPFKFTNDNYLDLAEINDYLDKTSLLQKKNILPENNPIAEATSLIIQTMKECNLSCTKIGVNELLKAYLLCVNKDNEKICTEVYSNFLFEIYLYSLKKDYPYTDLLWTYLSTCFHVVTQYLLEAGLVEGCQLFLQQMSAMGKTAAQKGLHTSNIQHFLHTLELRANELGFTELAAVAKNHRFNLEIF